MTIRMILADDQQMLIETLSLFLNNEKDIGGSSPEIAKCLFISPSTVDMHRSNIMKKLDLHNVQN